MPLGTEVDLGPDDVVLDGDEDPFQKGGRTPSPSFDPCLLWPNGWIDEDATWYGSRHRPRSHCVRRTEVPTKGAQQSPLFSAHVYCGHGRPSQSCTNGRLKTISLSQHFDTNARQYNL